MAAEIVKGFIIRKTKYQEYDQIITIINGSEILSFIALGTLKSNSKNGVSLQLGNIIEAEIFRSRLTGKVSKLKRSVIYFQPPLLVSDTANVMAQIIRNVSKLTDTNQALYKAIETSLKHLGKEFNHLVKTYITNHTLYPMGYKPNFNSCVECNRSDNLVDFSFYKGGVLCNLHSIHDTNDFYNAVLAMQKGFGTYAKNVSSKLNKEIYIEIKSFISEMSW